MIFIKIGHCWASVYFFWGEKTVLNVLCSDSWHGHNVLPRIANAKLDNKQCKLAYIDENLFKIIRLRLLGKAKSVVNIELWRKQKEKAKVKKKKTTDF